MHGSAAHDPDPTTDPVESVTSNPDHMYQRSRAFQEAMVAAKIDPRLQSTILYIAHHSDVHGVVRRVSLAYVAERLNYDSRGTVQHAVDVAREAGFLTTERDPRDKRKTIYRIPLMAAPRFARSAIAQLPEQLRDGGAQTGVNCAIADRAPSIEEVHIEEGRETDITREPFDFDELELLRQKLRLNGKRWS